MWACGTSRAVEHTTSPYLRPNGILNAHHSDAGEVGEDLGLVVPVWLHLARELPHGEADGPQPVARHRLDDLAHHLITVLGLERLGFT